MEYLIYRSEALVAPRSEACQKIVAVSQVNNASLGLTGFLHAEEGLFIQYLEGPSKPLWALYERLHLDHRHTNLILLARGNLDKRRFEDWRMGYSDDHVLTFENFKEQVPYFEPIENASGKQVLYFLMAACAYIDLGIVGLHKAPSHR